MLAHRLQTLLSNCTNNSKYSESLLLMPATQHQYNSNLEDEENIVYCAEEECNLTYLELLQRREWKQLRQRILERDGNRCTRCNKFETCRKWNNAKRDWSNYDVVFPKQIRKHLSYYCQNGTAESYYILDDTQFTFIEASAVRSLHVPAAVAVQRPMF